MKQIIILTLILLIVQINFGQNTKENLLVENWLSQYGIYQSPEIYLRYDRYSKDDLKNFREKLDLMKSSKFDNEWEGIYFDDFPDEVGSDQLRLSSKIGFVNYYVYSCLPELRKLSYGKVIDLGDTIQIISEVGKDSPQKPYSSKYVKVKWEGRNYLVEESAVPYFAEKAAGIYVEQKGASIENSQKWRRYWVKGDIERPLVGLPHLPASYKKFERLPIESRIILVGKRSVEEKTFEDNLQIALYEKSAWYSVTINAGQNKGVKEGMVFDAPAIQSEVIITKTTAKTSSGFIRRNIDENSKDSCIDDNYNRIPCKKIRPLLEVKTQVGNFWNDFF